MKTRNFTIAFIMTLFLSGCVVYSFYPLYTEKDLFPNDILTGEWYEEDEPRGELANDLGWTFKHPITWKNGVVHKKENGIVDSTSYILTLKTEDKQTKNIMSSEFRVHVIELGGYYFLDFYLEELPSEGEVTLASFHVIPVHTFAKLTVEEDRLKINWFDQDWMEDLIKENKIKIHHEANDDLILLTAQPKELQKFVTKYVNSEEAFEDGLEVVLLRK